MNTTSKTKISVANMWIALIKGAMLIIFGVWLLKSPMESLTKLSLIFGIVLILLAAIFIWHPEVLGITIAFRTAMAFISLGFFRIILVFKFLNV